MTAPLERERPRGAAYWGRQWGVHENTARKLLRWLHLHYGSKVVWKTGPGPEKRRAIVASQASLGFLKVTRAGRFVFCVSPMPADPAQPTPAHGGRRASPEKPVSRPEATGDEYVTQEQHSQAIAQLWRALGDLKTRQR